LVAVANNCSVGGTYVGVVAGAVVKGKGNIVPNNKCPSALTAANYGASTLNVQWIAAPPAQASVYSTVPVGSFLAGTTLDASGLTQNRNNVGPTPIMIQLGADWTPASAAQLAVDCSGPAPATRVLSFTSPGSTSTHQPAFAASI